MGIKVGDYVDVLDEIVLKTYGIERYRKCKVLGYNDNNKEYYVSCRIFSTHVTIEKIKD